MSRGLGKLQQGLLATIRRDGPITFPAMRGRTKLPAAVERSTRRALRCLVEGSHLVTRGHGGPGDPLRYVIAPRR